MKRVIMGIIILLAIGMGSEVVNADASDSKEASSKITATINKGETEGSNTDESTDTTTSSESADSIESSADSTESKKDKEDKDDKDYLKTDSSSNRVITITGISILGFICGYFMGRRFTKGEK